MPWASRLPAALALLLAATVGADDARPWFRRVLVGMEVGPTGAQFGHSDALDRRYCAAFDGAELVRRAAAAHSEYVVVWARDGDYAYYDSGLLPKTPGLAGRDPLVDAVAEGRRAGIPVIAYCVVQQGGHFLRAHPEWEMRGPDGRPLGRFCLNSGYLGAVKAILAEQLAKGVAGFHVDMLDQGFGPPYGCWCGACREQFRAQFGREMPPGATWDDDWDRMLEFRYGSSERFEKALRAHVRSLAPEVTVDFNYHGNPPFSFEVGQRPVQHAVNGDFVTGETGVWGFSALGVGLNAAFYRAATPGIPFQVAMQRGVRMYHDQTTRPLNDLRWELLTLLAHGAFVTMVDKTGFDGTPDPNAYGRIGEAFAEARAKRAHFGQDPVADVGLYFSSRTRDWVGRDDPARCFRAFQGAHRACVLGHVPFGVVLDENADASVLRRHPVVLLPDVAILSDAEVARLKAYVEDGGNLVVTGHTGQHGRTGKPEAGTRLQELVGARAVARLDTADNWVRFRKGTPPQGAGALATAFAGITPTDFPFLVEGPATVYEPLTAIPLGELMRPYRTTRQREGKEGTEWPMSAEAAVGPAVLLNRVGRGSVLTFACAPDAATGGEHAVAEARELLVRAVRFLTPGRRVTVEAPAAVEAVVTDDPKARELRVHLIAYQSTPRPTPARNRPFVLPGPVEDTPMFRAAVTLRDRPRGVRASGKGTRVTTRGHRVEATVEDLHEVLVIRY